MRRKAVKSGRRKKVHSWHTCIARTLASTKFDRMEAPDQLAGRIREASRFFPREQLALSTQCGFASAGPGNAISEGAQENKLRRVGEVADRVWRTGG